MLPSEMYPIIIMSGGGHRPQADVEDLPQFPTLSELVNLPEYTRLLSALLPILRRNKCLETFTVTRRSPWVKAFVDLYHPTGPWAKFSNSPDITSKVKYGFKSYRIRKIFEQLQDYKGQSRVHLDLLAALNQYYSDVAYVKEYQKASEEIALKEVLKDPNERAPIPRSAQAIPGMAQGIRQGSASGPRGDVGQPKRTLFRYTALDSSDDSEDSVLNYQSIGLKRKSAQPQDERYKVTRRKSPWCWDASPAIRGTTSVVTPNHTCRGLNTVTPTRYKTQDEANLEATQQRHHIPTRGDIIRPQAHVLSPTLNTRKSTLAHATTRQPADEYQTSARSTTLDTPDMDEIKRKRDELLLLWSRRGTMVDSSSDQLCQRIREQIDGLDEQMFELLTG